MKYISTGIAAITTHAPLRNFWETMTQNTMPVTDAPNPLITADRCQFFPLSRRHRRNIPDCDNVNEMNTPTRYSWIRSFRFALNTTIKEADITARIRTPFENTRRSPRLLNCRGMNLSCARIDESRGKSAYAVFAAR